MNEGIAMSELNFTRKANFYEQMKAQIREMLDDDSETKQERIEPVGIKEPSTLGETESLKGERFTEAHKAKRAECVVKFSTEVRAHIMLRGLKVEEVDEGIAMSGLDYIRKTLLTQAKERSDKGDDRR